MVDKPKRKRRTLAERVAAEVVKLNQQLAAIEAKRALIERRKAFLVEKEQKRIDELKAALESA